LWTSNAQVVDKDDKVIINSPETVKALEFAKALYGQMIPGTASWNDASNNKAFLAKEIHWTNNGISIYVAAQNSAKDVAEDMDHAYFPIGPAGKPTELHLMYPILAMTYTKYPQACKALMAFMLDANNFNPWIQSAKGYLTHCLNAYDKNPVWTADPRPRHIAMWPNVRSRPAALAPSVKRRQPQSRTLWCSTCSPTSAPVVKTPKARSR
jgi:multiple sugar transport system substrate-binding protein